jgi:VWFA-related protein
MPTRRIAIAMMVLAASLGRGAGQPASEPQPVPLVEQARSELVLIEVYARDLKGNLVTDLRADELTLRIDHMQKPQSIQSLEFIPVADERGGAASAPAASEADASGETASAEPAAPLSGIQAHRQRPRRFLLFFDDSTSSVPHMTAARKAAYDFLDGQGSPTDQFSVAVYGSKRKLDVLIEFTSDRVAVRAALKRSLDDAGRNEDYTSEREERFEEIDKAEKEATAGTGPKIPGTAESLRQAYASEDHMAMARVLNTLRVLVDALAGWDGYKAILMFGDGIPENPAMDYGLNDPRRALTSELSQLAFAASGSEVTLNAIQTEGVVAGSAAQNASSARRSNALATLALDTGGLQTRTNDPLKAMSDIEQSTHGYYLLAYAPEGPPDGAKHAVSLKCSRRGVTLRYRQFFTRFRTEDARQRSLEAAYSVPEIHDALGVQLAAVTGPVAGGERVVDLVVYVPAGRFLFLPRPGGAAGVAEVGVVALDADGHETLRQSRRVVLGVDMYRALHGGALGFDFYTRVRLPLGAQTLTAVVSDVQSGEVGAARIDLEKSPQTPGIHGLSLYSARDKSLWIDVQGKAAADAAPGAGGAFTIGPALKRRFTSGEKIACGFKPAAEATDPASLRLEVGRGEEVMRSGPIPGAASETSAGEARAEARKDTLEFELPIDGLEPGDYWLRVEQAQPSGPREVGRIPFGIVPG